MKSLGALAIVLLLFGLEFVSYGLFGFGGGSPSVPVHAPDRPSTDDASDAALRLASTLPAPVFDRRPATSPLTGEPKVSMPEPTPPEPIGKDESCDFRALETRQGASEFTVANYVPTFQACARKTDGLSRAAIRSMKIGGQGWLLLADVENLTTTIEKSACWVCNETSDEALANTRLIRSVTRASEMPGVAHRTFLQNAGLSRGPSPGDYLTGDLCPSNRPLDRRFFELISRGQDGPTPVALSVSGLWLKSHETDFRWLQSLQRDGKLDIVWVNHTYTHPYAAGRPFDHTFMMTQNLNPDFEILEMERLLISHGETPSIFFRFPGLISSSPLMQTLRRYHMIPLGADAWLAKGQRPRQGSIILVHPNGNEEVGLDVFEKLYREGLVNRPLAAITAAP